MVKSNHFTHVGARLENMAQRKDANMKFNLTVDHYGGEWRVINLQSGNDWQVKFLEYDDAYKFLMDLVTQAGVNQ